MIKTTTVIVGTFVISAIILGVISNKRESNFEKTVLDEINKINKKLDDINTQTFFTPKKMVVEEINRNTRPEKCKLENLKIDIFKPSINEFEIFNVSVDDAIKKMPCIDQEDRHMSRVSTNPQHLEKAFLGFHGSVADYNGESDYSFRLSKDVKKAYIYANEKLPISGLGFNWNYHPEYLKEKLNKKEYEEISKDKHIKKSAHKTNYGCLVVNYHNSDGMDILVKRIFMKNSGCQAEDVVIGKDEK